MFKASTLKSIAATTTGMILALLPFALALFIPFPELAGKTASVVFPALYIVLAAYLLTGIFFLVKWSKGNQFSIREKVGLIVSWFPLLLVVQSKKKE